MIQIERLYELESTHKTAMPIIYQLLASFFMAVTSLFVKLLPNLPATQILVVRSIITIIMVYFMINKYDIDCYPKQQSIIKKLLMRGLLGSIGATLWFMSIKLVNLSEAIVLQKTNPLWTTLIAVFFLRTEKLTLKSCLNIIMCIFGVALIARPPFIKSLFGEEVVENQEYENHALGVIFALATSLLTAIIQVLISSLSGQVNQLAILQYFSLFTITYPMIYQFYSPFEDFKSPTMFEWFNLLMNGIAGCLAQILMNRSFILGDLTQISLVGQSQVVISFVFDLIILHQQLNMLSIFGIVLVLGSLVFVVLIKKKKK